MMNSSDVRRLAARGAQLTPRRWRLAVEALVWLSLAGLAIRCLPFQRVGRLASRRLRPRPAADDAAILSDVRWAVEAAARRTKWAVCFQQGLAAQIMLRRRGVDSTLYYGAGPDKAAGLSAHVWVRADGADVVGCEEASHYVVLATFPQKNA